MVKKWSSPHGVKVGVVRQSEGSFLTIFLVTYLRHVIRWQCIFRLLHRYEFELLIQCQSIWLGLNTINNIWNNLTKKLLTNGFSVEGTGNVDHVYNHSFDTITFFLQLSKGFSLLGFHQWEVVIDKPTQIAKKLKTILWQLLQAFYSDRRYRWLHG